jgi:hypothetical protein
VKLVVTLWSRFALPALISQSITTWKITTHHGEKHFQKPNNTQTA